MPFVVDFKKGFSLLKNKDMWKMPSKADNEWGKRKEAQMRRQWRASGTRDSFVKWLDKKGLVEKRGCSVM